MLPLRACQRPASSRLFIAAASAPDGRERARSMHGSWLRLCSAWPLQALPVFLEVDAFSKFSTVVQKVAEAHPDMPLVRIVSLHLALLQFVIRVYKDRLDYVDQVLV